MKAYGSIIHRNGTRAHKFDCCDARNGCYATGRNTPANRAIDRTWKGRARQANRAVVIAAIEEIDNEAHEAWQEHLSYLSNLDDGEW